MTPTREQVIAVFRNSLFYEILFTFGVPHHDPSDYCCWESVNFCRMCHARVLYTFLETKERRADDVIAEDFGFPAQAITLPTEDRRRLNKDLFHLTYSRLRHRGREKHWPDSILHCLHAPTIEIMEHVLDHDDLFPEPRELHAWRDLVSKLRAGRELRIRFTDQQYEVTLGHPIPNGTAALTRWEPRSRLRVEPVINTTITTSTISFVPAKGIHFLK